MDVRGYVESNAREFIDDFKQWLTIPSISAVLLGRGASDDESADTSLLLRGAEASAYLWHELAAADLR
jgi:hypothetical protein